MPTGFLVRFAEGFSSPPHVHNVSYRALVLRGHVHNDDPGAAPMWMPPGSYWTQPAGEAHITAAEGEEVVAFVEIDRGPYLVRSVAQAFDNGERPLNVHRDNILWQQDGCVSHAPLWPGNGRAAPARLWRFEGELALELPKARLVVVVGPLKRRGSAAPLAAGSLLELRQPASLDLRCEAKTACLLYLKALGR